MISIKNEHLPSSLTSPVTTNETFLRGPIIVVAVVAVVDVAVAADHSVVITAQVSTAAWEIALHQKASATITVAIIHRRHAEDLYR
jgi:hypothetical protein